MVSTEILGLIGTIIIIGAYIPQMRHIVKEHCSGGVSLRAWVIWLVATVLIFIHSLSTGDRIFIALQVVNLVSISIIILLILKYKGKMCHSVVRNTKSDRKNH